MVGKSGEVHGHCRLDGGPAERVWQCLGLAV